ncbi:MAG: sensor histidine kinase [Janthinobacterium lividum]
MASQAVRHGHFAPAAHGEVCYLCCRSPQAAGIADVSWDGSSALVWDVERLRIATDAAGVALWSWNVDTDEIAMDHRAHALWGVPRGTLVTFEELSSRIHPADVERVRNAFEATRSRHNAYEIDFRLQDREVVRWVSARGKGNDEGIVDRTMFGVFLDVTERKQAEEARDMVAGEMSHRVKNLFSIASALTGIAARSATTTTEMARDLVQRLTALGQAHDLVRPVPGHGKAALLGDLLTVLLAPYAGQEASDRRVHVAVPEMPVGEAAATTLALIVHELATNSIKYGALSMADGTLAVTCATHDDEVVLLWTERGGPPVAIPAGPPGYGSKLITQSVSRQLGGSIAYAWPAEGMVATLRMRMSRLAT